jgi:transcriptional regulator with XRE-family HTH domain
MSQEKSKQMVIFAERLSQAIAKRGGGAVALASETGLTPTAISYYVNGKRMPGAIELSRISKALGVPMEVLLGQNDNPPQPPTQWRSSLRDRIKTDEDLDSIPKIYAIAANATVEDMEEAMAKNLQAMRSAKVGEKSLYLRLIAHYIAGLHEQIGRMKGGAGIVGPTTQAPATTADLSGQKISTDESLQGVDPQVREIARGGALTAQRLIRDAESAGKRKAGGSSGGKGGPAAKSGGEKPR